MKGIVFNEFTELVEAKFGDEMLDDIIDDCYDDLASGGAYTSVSTYDHTELVKLVVALSARTGISVPDLVQTFGLHLAKIFAEKFPSFFAECEDSFSFFKKIDDHIHVEVHKLYPDAELPKFSYQQSDHDTFTLTYESNRHFSQLALGLLQGVANFYGETLQIDQEDFSTEQKSKVIFYITRA